MVLNNVQSRLFRIFTLMFFIFKANKFNRMLQPKCEKQFIFLKSIQIIFDALFKHEKIIENI